MCIREEHLCGLAKEYIPGAQHPRFQNSGRKDGTLRSILQGETHILQDERRESAQDGGTAGVGMFSVYLELNSILLPAV